MRIRVIAVPYDLGVEAAGMGRGPGRWLEAGLADALDADGHRVEVTIVRPDGAAPIELEAIEAVNRALAAAVREAVAEGALPLVLAGNCNSAIGTLGGLGGGRAGVAWFDAHGDFNTPDTSPGGFFDGMAISVITGACHRGMWDRVAGRPPVPEADIVLAGFRDLDAAERERLDRSGVVRVPADAIRRAGVERALGAAVDALAERVGGVYLHIDLDTLDPAVARVNSYQAPDGLTLEDLGPAIDRIRGRLAIRAAALTAFDPEHDAGGRGAAAGTELARRIVNRDR